MTKKFGINMPSTLLRSPEKAQRTFAKTLLSAEASYGIGERARRAAFASLKHSFEKVDDHWEPKRQRGPSDPQAALQGAQARAGKRATAGGVDVNGQTREALYQRAQSLDIPGRSLMNKQELAHAIARKQGRKPERSAVRNAAVRDASARGRG